MGCEIRDRNGEVCGRKIFALGLCTTHRKWMGFGKDMTVPVITPRLDGIKRKCKIKGCSRTAQYTDICKLHKARIARHGDPHIVLKGGRKPGFSPESHPKWKGDQGGYYAAHSRVVRKFGKASEYNCIDCQDVAVQWSYDHKAHDEKVDTKRGAFSLDPNHYWPRCCSCHKKFDLMQKA